MEYYGLAKQVFASRFTYLTRTYDRDLEFDEIKFVSKKNNDSTEIVNRMLEEGVKVASLERTIIDCIDSPFQAGGLEEVIYALENIQFLDFDKIKEILILKNKNFLYQKVGYLFEKYYLGKIENTFFDFCLANIGNKVNYLNCAIGKGTLNSK